MTIIDPTQNDTEREMPGKRNSAKQPEKVTRRTIKGTLPLGILTVALIFGAGCVYLAHNKKNRIPVNQKTTSTRAPSYQDFIGAWNGKVRKFELHEEHLLPSADSKKLVEELRAYMEFYTHPIEPVTNQSLETIAHEYPGSLWRYYYDFLSAHLGKYILTEQDWNSVNTSHDLFNVLSRVTGNSDFDESIEEIIASSDPCAFFEFYKYELWNKKGLSRNFKKCSPEIIDQAKFPELAALIRR